MFCSSLHSPANLHKSAAHASSMCADACVVCKLAGVADGTGALHCCFGSVCLFWLLQAVAVAADGSAAHAVYFWAPAAALCGAAGATNILRRLLGCPTSTRVPTRRCGRRLVLWGLWLVLLQGLLPWYCLLHCVGAQKEGGWGRREREKHGQGETPHALRGQPAHQSGHLVHRQRSPAASYLVAKMLRFIGAAQQPVLGLAERLLSGRKPPVTPVRLPKGADTRVEQGGACCSVHDSG